MIVKGVLTMAKETECPCTKNDCKRRGDCVACFTYHLDNQTLIACKRYIVPNDLKKRVNAKLKALVPLGSGIQ